jgi:antitoxin (DNA-binding transcriptional repressor) of toxin-antitoxin stability system
MKTASVRDLRRDFPRILGWVKTGAEVVIAMRRQVGAKLIPWPQERAARCPMPDIGTRLKKVFGAKIIADKTMKSVMEQKGGRLESLCELPLPHFWWQTDGQGESRGIDRNAVRRHEEHNNPLPAGLRSVEDDD